jgi:CheY-like chemotaxis protein
MNEQLSTPKILIVEDNKAVLMALSESLKDYKLSFATNGKQAIKIAHSSNSPDLILLDVMMPGIDGFEVCKILKSDNTTSSIPIIFLTGKSDAADELKGLKLGAVDYVRKPVSPPILRQRIKNHLILKLAIEFFNKKTYGRQQRADAIQKILKREIL